MTVATFVIPAALSVVIAFGTTMLMGMVQRRRQTVQLEISTEALIDSKADLIAQQAQSNGKKIESIIIGLLGEFRDFEAEQNRQLTAWKQQETGRLEALDKAVADLRDVAIVQDPTPALQALEADVRVQIGALDARVDALGTTVVANMAQSDRTVLEQNVTAALDRLDAIEGQIAQTNNNSADAKPAVTELADQLSVLDQRLTGFTEAESGYADLTATLAALTDRVDELQQSQDERSDRQPRAAIEEDLAALAARIAALEADHSKKEDFEARFAEIVSRQSDSMKERFATLERMVLEVAAFAKDVGVAASIALPDRMVSIMAAPPASLGAEDESEQIQTS